MSSRQQQFLSWLLDNHDCGSIVVYGDVRITKERLSSAAYPGVVQCANCLITATANSRHCEPQHGNMGPAWPGQGDTVTSLTLIPPPPPQLTTALRTTTHTHKYTQKSTKRINSWVWVNIRESLDYLDRYKNVAASYLHIQGVVFDVDWENGF